MSKRYRYIDLHNAMLLLPREFNIASDTDQNSFYRVSEVEIMTPEVKAVVEAADVLCGAIAEFGTKPNELHYCAGLIDALDEALHKLKASRNG